jgi:hypothetical protein
MITRRLKKSREEKVAQASGLCVDLILSRNTGWKPVLPDSLFGFFKNLKGFSDDLF